MLVRDLHLIGNKLLAARKRAGLTQAEAAEAAEISDRTYADIERGTVNMRLETLLRICQALHITPDQVLTEPDQDREAEILARLSGSDQRVRQTALGLIDLYLRDRGR